MIFFAITQESTGRNKSEGTFYIPESAKSYGVYVYLVEYCHLDESDASDASEWCDKAEIGEEFIIGGVRIKIVDDDRYDND